LTRQFTCLAVWVGFALSAWRMYDTMTWGFVDEWFPNLAISLAMVVRYALPTILLVGGVWFGYRLVNYAPFADFLIAVEAEMNKVTWPSRTEMVRSAIVVIVIMFGLTLVIFIYDGAALHPAAAQHRGLNGNRRSRGNYGRTGCE
jgi:preprotein translocase subunit SecE